jgi:hypothetical protein
MSFIANIHVGKKLLPFAAVGFLFLFNIFLSVITLKFVYTYETFYSKLFLGTQTFARAKNNQLILGEAVGPNYQDSRQESLEKFFAEHNSDLYPYAGKIVEVSDKYGFHYGLLPAIAMVESNLCKKIPENSFNCWGWGIYGKKVTRFVSYDEAIDTVARGIKRDYIDNGFVTVEQIMTKYNPTNHNNWLGGVNFFLNTLN